MIVFPAIDLRNGHVVRLKEGDPDRQTVFSADPMKTAQQWIDEGAQWIHMVNLDGAFSEANDNLSILSEVAKLDVNVQFGGGLRNQEDIKKAFDLGAKRLILGTVAYENPQIVTEAIETYGSDAICVALDAKDGKVTTRGWQETTDMTPTELGLSMLKKGVKYALYTDVKRDGSLIGVNVHETVNLARSTGLQIIASGGVSTTQEIYQLAHSQVVAGVIIGMALYENKITLNEALLAAERGNAR